MKEKKAKKAATKKPNKYDVVMKFSGSADDALKTALTANKKIKNGN